MVASANILRCTKAGLRVEGIPLYVNQDEHVLCVAQHNGFARFTIQGMLVHRLRDSDMVKFMRYFK